MWMPAVPEGKHLQHGSLSPDSLSSEHAHVTVTLARAHRQGVPIQRDHWRHRSYCILARAESALSPRRPLAREQMPTVTPSFCGPRHRQFGMSRLF